MSVKKSLAIAVSLFLMASGLDAAVAVAVNPVVEVTKLLTAVQADKHESSMAVAARAEIMKLDATQLGQILTTNPANIFKTPYGFSLIHGWMLNKFSTHDLPFYINQNFSFDKYIRNLIGAMPAAVTAAIKQNISGKWDLARAAIEKNRWAYYQHMQYIPAAIAQAGTAVGALNTMPAVIKSAYILALLPGDLKEHMNSIIAGGIPAGVPQAKAKFESIMTLLLNRYNIETLLPPGKQISDVEKFAEFVVEHVKELYVVPTPGALNNVNALNAEQTGEKLRLFVNALMQVSAPTAAAVAVPAVAEEGINIDIAQAAFSAVALVRQHQVTTDVVGKIAIPAEILPVYSEDVVAISGAGGPVSPLKSPGKALKSGVLSPLPKGMKHIAGGGLGLTEFQARDVYETILMDQLDAPFVTLSFCDITDILKFFASYLDKVKGVGNNNYPDKGPNTGNWPGRTFLSEVLAMRYRILAGDGSADLNGAHVFLNRCRQDITNSMVKQGMMIKDRSAAGGGVARKLVY